MYFEAFLTDLKSRVTISEVVGRSTKLRRDGKEFRAVDNASLTINDQKGLWWDHSTNEGGDALAWLQKMQGLSFTDAVAEIASMAGVPLPNGDGRERPRGATTKRKQVATCNYCDAQGELIYQVIRFEWLEDGKRCKTFRQRRPDPEKPGDWIWNLEGVPHGLYRLPELREAGADEIVFCRRARKTSRRWSNYTWPRQRTAAEQRTGGKTMLNYFAAVTSSCWSITMIRGESAARRSSPRCMALRAA
jgi:CHC2 zinc finger